MQADCMCDLGFRTRTVRLTVVPMTLHRMTLNSRVVCSGWWTCGWLGPSGVISRGTVSVSLRLSSNRFVSGLPSSS